MTIRKLSNYGGLGSSKQLYSSLLTDNLPYIPTNAPTNVSATDVGTNRAYNNGAAVISFTAPSATGAGTASSYTVRAYDSSGVYQNITASGSSSPITVTGLTSSTQYKYTVYATNAAGNSAESSFSNLLTATTVPQAPTIGTATATSATQATVGVTANATGGKSITSYTATSNPGSITGSGASSPITVSGLTGSTSYTFTVTATNENGTSAASGVSNSITTPAPAADLITQNADFYKSSDSYLNFTYTGTPAYSGAYYRALVTNGNGTWVVPARSYTTSGAVGFQVSTNLGATVTFVDVSIGGSSLSWARNFGNMGYSNGYFYAGAPDSPVAGVIPKFMRSANGTSWTSYNITPVGTGVANRGATYVGGGVNKYIASLDNQGNFYYSTDLSTWTQRSLGFTLSGIPGAINTSQTIAVYGADTNAVVVWNSTYPNGATRTNVTGYPGNQLSYIVCYNDIFLTSTPAGAQDTLATSTDGYNWSQRSHPWGSSIGISGAVAGSRFYISNDQGTRGYAYSSNGITWTIGTSNNPTSTGLYNQGGGYGI